MKLHPDIIDQILLVGNALAGPEPEQRVALEGVRRNHLVVRDRGQVVRVALLKAAVLVAA